MPRLKDDEAARNYKIAIGDRLHALRDVYGMSQAQFAEQISTNQETYHKWESGKIFPNPVTMMILCARYRVDFNYIYMGNFNILSDDKKEKVEAMLKQTSR